MTAAASLAGAWLLIVAAGLYWAARLLHIGNLDAHGLAEKLGAPDPGSALEWPELRVHAFIPQPGEPSLLLLVLLWPAHPECSSTLLLDLAPDGERSLALLSRWCGTQASLSPTRLPGERVELRRRQSLQRITGRVLSEDVVVDSPDDTDALHGERGRPDRGTPDVD
jgi:hypothetical protein